MSDEKKTPTETTLARELVAGELLGMRKRWREIAEAQRDAGLEAVADVSVAAAGVFADLFRQLTGRHPGEVE